MRVILQEKLANWGNVGDQVTVKPGFARNFLFPYGKAIPATAENMAEFEKRRGDLEKAAAEVLAKAKHRAESLASVSIKIGANASEEGKLFGSIGSRDIAQAITKAGVAVEKREVNLPEGPIRQVGEYDIQVQLHSDVKTTVKVSIVAE
jgi:large subunit ribosomal protein L9